MLVVLFITLNAIIFFEFLDTIDEKRSIDFKCVNSQMTKFKVGWRKQNFLLLFGPPYYGYNNMSTHAIL
jgi:hypothetical protein